MDPKASMTTKSANESEIWMKKSKYYNKASTTISTLLLKLSLTLARNAKRYTIFPAVSRFMGLLKMKSAGG